MHIFKETGAKTADILNEFPELFSRFHVPGQARELRPGMKKESLISLTKMVKTGLSIGRSVRAVLGTATVARRKHVAFLAEPGQRVPFCFSKTGHRRIRR